MVYLLFGSIISAVDPVAVIAVFDEIHVNITLYILVFGESLLNDGIAVVLYQIFKEFIYLGNDDVNAKNIGLSLVSLVLIFFGGTGIGVIFGYVTAFFSKFTEIIKFLEPLVIFSLAYISYLLSEMLGWSAILSIVAAGFIMRYYLEKNLSHDTLHFIHSGIKLIAVICEMIIFVMLGMVAAISSWKTHFFWGFSLTALLFCTIFRPLYVVLLTWLLNKTRDQDKQISWKDQFIMSFSGLRGGIAFSLMSLSNLDFAIDGNAKSAFILTTIFIVFFTSFIQGALCGPLCNFFKIEKQSEEELEHKFSHTIHSKTLFYLTSGIADITGQNRRKFDTFHKLVNPFLIKNYQKVDEAEVNFNEILEIWQNDLKNDMVKYHQQLSKLAEDSDQGLNQKPNPGFEMEKLTEGSSP